MCACTSQCGFTHEDWSWIIFYNAVGMIQYHEVQTQQTIKEQAQWKVEPQIMCWTAIYDTKPDILKAFVFTNTTLYSQVRGIRRGMCRDD